MKIFFYNWRDLHGKLILLVYAAGWLHCEMTAKDADVAIVPYVTAVTFISIEEARKKIGKDKPVVVLKDSGVPIYDYEKKLFEKAGNVQIHDFPAKKPEMLNLFARLVKEYGTGSIN